MKFLDSNSLHLTDVRNKDWQTMQRERTCSKNLLDTIKRKEEMF